MKKAALAVLLLGAALCIPGCGFEEGAGASVTVIQATPTPIPTPTPEATPTPEVTPTPAIVAYTCTCKLCTACYTCDPGSICTCICTKVNICIRNICTILLGYIHTACSLLYNWFWSRSNKRYTAYKYRCMRQWLD